MLLEHLVHFENIIEVWGLFVEMEGWKGAMVRPRQGHKTLLPPLYGASTYISEATTLKYQLRPSRERGKDLWQAGSSVRRHFLSANCKCGSENRVYSDPVRGSWVGVWCAAGTCLPYFPTKAEFIAEHQDAEKGNQAPLPSLPALRSWLSFAFVCKVKFHGMQGRRLKRPTVAFLCVHPWFSSPR